MYFNIKLEVKIVQQYGMEGEGEDRQFQYTIAKEETEKSWTSQNSHE